MKSNIVHTCRRWGLRALVPGVVAALCATPLLAQDKQLILQTQPDPTVIDLTGSMQIDGNGNISVTPVDLEACTATGSCEGVDVSISSFTANGQGSALSVPQGQSISFRWTTRGAWACDGGGLTGWSEVGKLPSNSTGESVATGTLNPGNYTATLSCYNGSVIADPSRSVDIEIVEDDNPPPPPPQGCENRTMPSDWNRMTSGSNNCSYRFGITGNGLDDNDDCRWFGKDGTHSGVWPWPWDEQVSFQKVLGVPSSNNGKHYIALEFNSGTAPDGEKTINVNVPQSSNLENAQKLISISTCPGDFNKQAIDSEMGPGCLLQSFTTALDWGGAEYISDPFSCGLQPNTRYYFNVIFTNSPPGTAPSDIEPNCTNFEGCGSRFTPGG